ncbi:hypothetical protein PMAYCL1PPCAC_17412, partial [Pristionchus mayeri]
MNSLPLLVLVVAFASVTDAVMSMEDKVACFMDTAEKTATEPDADLKAKLTATLNTIKGVAGKIKALTPAQRQQIIDNYFTGT